MGIICQSFTLGQSLNIKPFAVTEMVSYLVFLISVPYHSTLRDISDEALDSFRNSSFWSSHHCPIQRKFFS